MRNATIGDEGTSVGNHSNRKELSNAAEQDAKSFRAWRNAAIVWPVTFLVIIAAVTAQKTFRVMQSEQQLKELHAEYTWSHASFDRQSGEKPNFTHGVLAKYLGNALVSDVSKVKLSDEGLSDQDLSVLAGLKHLRSLDLGSRLASDETLKLISKLPDLRYLTLTGSQFTIYGLLQLREAHQLRQLCLNTEELSAVEVAVLKSQLPEVKLIDSCAEMPQTTRQMYPVEQLSI
ncbi:MAG: hypothetical protein AAF483_07260 [Planctomycetota bacterium]